MSVKSCRVCGEEKPLDQFHHNAGMKDGRLNKCKSCVSKYNAGRYRANREQRKARATAYRKQHPEKAAACVRRWKKRNAKRVAQLNRESDERHPQRAQARRELRKAVRTGKVSKPDLCEQCETEPGSRRLHAHHGDYSKPLEVEWLCSSCHAERHQKGTS